MQRESFQSDDALVDAVVAGDKARFAELVHRYEPVARAAAVAICGDTHLAQDVVQEAFLLAYTNLGKLADRARFGPWVLKIARRQALRTRRGRKHTEGTLEGNEPQSVEEDQSRLDDDSRELLDAVARLPDHEQVAVVLHYFEQHQVEMIALMTGRSTSTVTKQLSRARRRLEKWLRKAE
jgi:RNA polymerase sigma-70 factor (ECF subfamily)